MLRTHIVLFFGLLFFVIMAMPDVEAADTKPGLQQYQVKPGRLKGFIRDSSRKKLAGQKVSIADANGKTVSSSVSDKYGMYEFKNLPEGAYYLKLDDQKIARLLVTKKATVSTIQIVVPANATLLTPLQWTLIAVGGTAVVVGTVAIINNNDSSSTRVSP